MRRRVYRGDLAEITTVHPILLKQRHFMVFFNMILPCLSHQGLFREVKGFYRGDLARITYSISHSIEPAGGFSQLKPEKVGGFCT